MVICYRFYFLHDNAVVFLFVVCVSLAVYFFCVPQVIQLHTKLFVQGNPVTVKYALARMGRIFDSLRVPLVPMEDQFKPEVDLALESAGLLAPGVRHEETVDVNIGV